MIVAHITMWPSGRRDAARLLSTAALDLIGVAQRDDAEQGIRQGERAYRVRIFKDAQFGGPGIDDDLRRAPVWRQGFVRGHNPGVGRRGTWDLLGGALGVLLKGRLDPYVPTSAAKVIEEPDVTIDRGPFAERCDECGRDWVILATVRSAGKPPHEVMAAHDCDGIGVLSVAYQNPDGTYRMRTVDTESGEVVDDAGGAS